MSLFLLLLLTGGLSWGVAYLALFSAQRLHWVQTPNERSAHSHPTPHGGGLGPIVVSSLAGGLLAYQGEDTLWWMTGLGLVLALIGLRDDIHPLSAKLRLSAQFCVVLLLLTAWLPPSPFSSPWLGLVFLLLTGIWWINLFNFMDGIDGLAGSQALFMLTAAGTLSYANNPAVSANPVWLLMAIVAASCLGFLLLNWPKASIFMGDAGSTYLAFTIFAAALASVREGWLDYTTWAILGSVFVCDATVTLLRRMKQGEAWMQAHCSHAYQRLSRYLGSHLPVTVGSIAINLLWVAPLAWTAHTQPHWGWACLMLAYAPLLALAAVLGAGKPGEIEQGDLPSIPMNHR